MPHKISGTNTQQRIKEILRTLVHKVKSISHEKMLNTIWEITLLHLKLKQNKDKGLI